MVSMRHPRYAGLLRASFAARADRREEPELFPAFVPLDAVQKHSEREEQFYGPRNTWPMDAGRRGRRKAHPRNM
jgi:hypothetical protein